MSRSRAQKVLGSLSTIRKVGGVVGHPEGVQARQTAGALLAPRSYPLRPRHTGRVPAQFVSTPSPAPDTHCGMEQSYTACTSETALTPFPTPVHAIIVISITMIPVTLC
jgi:hypothetical protein